MAIIQALCRSHGMTLVALALKVDIPTRTLGAIELGILPLDGDCAARLAAFFGIAPEFLDATGSTAQPAVIPHDRAMALRCTALAAALISGLLLCQTALPNHVPHTGRLTIPTAQWKVQHQQPELVFGEPQPLLPAQAKPKLPPLRMSNPATLLPRTSQTPPMASQRHMVVLPLPPDGPFRQNVLAALTANGGALQQVVVPPGGTWSFNRAVGDPDRLELATINGVTGGGWCELASYYVLALRPFLPRDSLVFTRHVDATGYGLQGIEDDVAVAIWNTNGGDDERDLVIHNTSGRMMVINATLVDAGVQVSAESRSAPINPGRVH
jgi:hypothetical protein